VLGNPALRTQNHFDKIEVMQTLAAGVSYFDLNFQNRARVIACAVLHGPGGVALIDPGPSSTLPTLHRHLSDAGISLADVTTILLTHIHLDHAGAAGTLVRENPQLRVYVHEIGAPHMADPSKLLASATRLYGDAMDRLWGEVAPVPPAAMTTLHGGEQIDVAGRSLEVAYTPGHASHHVSYFSADSGVAFVGDTAGVRVVSNGFVLPPTPPPDIDLEAWRASLQTIGRWRADTLFVTHFGPHAPAAAHLTEMADHLDLVGGLVRTSLDREGDDESREAWYADEIRRALRRRMPEAAAQAYEVAGRFDLNWKGLARYWRKRGG
jgi:glyoxylase-like metal-dependent hydrolase (beta-lactamase superfamily II)